MSQAKSNKIMVLQKWLKGEVVTASFSKAHNAGQYPWYLETQNDIKCRVIEYPNPKGGRAIKGRKLVLSKENIRRTKEILSRLGGKVPSQIDESKES